jgi:hypothetical protein
MTYFTANLTREEDEVRAEMAHAAESLGVAPELLASTVALLRMVPR